MVAPVNFPWSFRNVFIRTKDIVITVLSEDESMNTEVPVSSLLKWDKDDWVSQASHIGNGTAYVEFGSPPSRMLLGKEGIIYLWRDDGSFEEEIIDSTEYGPQFYGDLEDLRIIDDKAYVAGVARSVYVRTGPKQWIPIDIEIRSEEGDASFFSIDGYSDQELYGVGTDGEIAWFDGKSWNFPGSGTNLILYRVLCAPNGIVYVCGQNGTLIAGRKNQWKLINQTVTEETFWGSTWFKDRLYLSTVEGIYRLVDDDLEPIRIENAGKRKIKIKEGISFYRLDAKEDVLWSVGSKMAIWTNDGIYWNEVPYN